ncbi:MAG: polyprenyl synthetase family protein [Burkholderiales bacterium]|nr:polyprenyl synthetase family protein [Burkholderiales bacterium]
MESEARTAATAPLPFATWADVRQRRIEGVLDRTLASVPAIPAELTGAMRYAVLGGGKRMRPLLAYAAGELTQASPEAVDGVAAAVEMIHAYSLVHDDLPCMDDDVLRRGKPTCHVAYGEAMALLAGDALQAQAFAVLQSARLADPAAACRLLAQSAGAAGMAGGQAIDLLHVGKALALPALEVMHRMKTGALIRAAILLGAQCGRAVHGTEAALAGFARSIGLAFQVVDDVLDVEGSAASLGKTAGKDAASHKPTYVSLLGLDAAKAHAQALREEAQAALAPFGTRARRLHEIADWIVRRDH